MKKRLYQVFKLARKRTLLANERTMLAYVRTGFGMGLTGLGVLKFFGQLFGAAVTTVVSSALIISGLCVLIFGLVMYVKRRTLIQQYYQADDSLTDEVLID